MSLDIRAQEQTEEFALETTADVKKAFRLLRNAYKSEKSEGTQVYHKQEDVLDPFSGLCIECESLTEFTNQINDVLTQLPQTNEHSQTRISELMAHSAYTELVDRNNVFEHCFKQSLTGMTEEYEDINVDDAVIIYSGEMDVKRVNSFSLFGKTRYKRSVFLRGKKPDADKLIRVDLDPDKKPVVTLYQLQEDTSEIYAFQRDKTNASLPSFEIDPPENEKKTPEQEDFYSRTKKVPSKPVDPMASQINAFDMEYSSSGFPKKVTLLDFRDRSKITQDFEAQSDIEISSEDQEMTFGLARTGKASMAEMRVEKEGDVELAFDMNLPTGIVQSQFLIGDGGAGAEFNLNHSENSRTKISHTTADKRTSVEHSTDFGNRSRLALRFQRSNGRESGHLEYKIVF